MRYRYEISQQPDQSYRYKIRRVSDGFVVQAGPLHVRTWHEAKAGACYEMRNFMHDMRLRCVN